MSDEIHNWFELTYAQYLTIPRLVLQSMPEEWQHNFVRLLDQLDDTIDWHPKEGQYRVILSEVVTEWDEDRGERQAWGRELDDPLMDYERGRRQLPHRKDWRERRAERLITDDVVVGVREWLGEEGLAFFRGVYAEHGKVNVVLAAEDGDTRIPHPVHFREGMQIRNKMRELTSYMWPNDDYENLWDEVVLRAIGVKGEM